MCVQDILSDIPGLQEALNDLESMLMHNKHIDKMLLYKGMQRLEDMLGGWGLRTVKPLPPANASEQGAASHGAFPQCQGNHERAVEC